MVSPGEPLPSPYLALLLPQLRHLCLHVELHPVALEHLEGGHGREKGTSGLRTTPLLVSLCPLPCPPSGLTRIAEGVGTTSIPNTCSVLLSIF